MKEFVNLSIFKYKEQTPFMKGNKTFSKSKPSLEQDDNKSKNSNRDSGRGRQSVNSSSRCKNLTPLTNYRLNSNFLIGTSFLNHDSPIDRKGSS